MTLRGTTTGPMPTCQAPPRCRYLYKKPYPGSSRSPISAIIPTVRSPYIPLQCPAAVLTTHYTVTRLSSCPSRVGQVSTCMHTWVFWSDALVADVWRRTSTGRLWKSFRSAILLFGTRKCLKVSSANGRTCSRMRRWASRAATRRFIAGRSLARCASRLSFNPFNFRADRTIFSITGEC